MTASVMQGSYANLVFIKTRKVVQMHVEFPLEYAEKLVSMFGAPNPESEIAVAVARLDIESKDSTPDVNFSDAGSSKGKTPDLDSGNAGSSPAPAAKREWHDLPRAEQAGIRCGEGGFQDWMTEKYGVSAVLPPEDGTAIAVRSLCMVKSRSRLDINEEAGKRWDALDTEYLQAMGRMAEDRGG